MYKKIIILSIGLSMLVSGCEKAVSSYEKPDDITISTEMYRNPLTQLPMTFTQDEEIIIPLKYTINDPQMTKGNLSFTWYFGNEIVSNEETLNLGYLAPGLYSGLVVITDNRNGIEYSQQVSFTVTTIYTDGWAVISDDGSKAELGYLSIDDETGDFVFTEDVYGKANDGASLSSGAGHMVYHYYNIMAPQIFGLTVFQPGEEGPVDLNPQDMTVFGKIKENFISEVPAGNFRDISWNSQTNKVCLVGGDGQLYFKEEYFYNREPVPFAAKFSSPYVMPEKYNVTDLINTDMLSSVMIGMTVYLLAYDEQNSRMLSIMDTEVTPFTEAFYTNGDNETHWPGDPGDDGSGVPVDGISFPGPEDLSDYEVVKVIACGFDAAATLWGTPGYLTIAMFMRSKASPEDVYLLTFDYKDDSSTWVGKGNIDIDLQLFYKWPQNLYPIDPETMLIRDNIGASHTFYFTGEGNRDIYYFDTSNAFVRKIYTSDTEITAFRQGEVGNGAMAPGLYEDLFVIGDGNGKITVLDMANVPGTNAEVVDEVQTDAGGITCMEFLPNNAYML